MVKNCETTELNFVYDTCFCGNKRWNECLQVSLCLQCDGTIQHVVNKIVRAYKLTNKLLFSALFIILLIATV